MCNVLNVTWNYEIFMMHDGVVRKSIFDFFYHIIHTFIYFVFLVELVYKVMAYLLWLKEQSLSWLSLKHVRRIIYQKRTISFYVLIMFNFAHFFIHNSSIKTYKFCVNSCFNQPRKIVN